MRPSARTMWASGYCRRWGGRERGLARMKMLLLGGSGYISAGIVDPVGLGVEGQGRLGLGKLEQDQEYTNAENVTRKRLEVEIQADEDAERTQRRELQAEKEQRIREEVQAVLQKFFCEVCHKQYQNAIELEGHLGSYDHHHKKRLAEMRAMVSGRNKSTRIRREQRQLEKEMAGFNDQLQRARRGREQSGQAAASLAQEEPKAGVDLTSQRSTIQFGFGGKKTGQQPQGISLSGRKGAPAQLNRPGKKALPAPNIAAFGDSSSSEDDG
ncbi:unnamed protein product [Ostreobium quekettii]|uniref:C2H2-type domain-containing protein n=1 Tax=Ostreobium quekettii TaxID=121088 RepID=A0A8S1ILT1_9CHLO|nr:unnamed protein product [Ostreobium quekettii]